MVFTDTTFKYFSLQQYYIRKAWAETQAVVPYAYESESFFIAYDAMYRRWKQRQSQRKVASALGISRNTLHDWEERFCQYGAIGLLSQPSSVEVDPRLERLVVITREARPHVNSRYIITLANGLQIPGATLELIHRVQRSHGYGQRLDKNDVQFFGELQKILEAVKRHFARAGNSGHTTSGRAKTFFDYDRDPFQHRVELFRALATGRKRRQVRSILHRFGVQSSRFYSLKARYESYGIRGLVELIHVSRKKGEKISPELELSIIEQRLINPSLSARKIIKALDLQCSRANVQKIYSRWGLPSITLPISIRGIIPSEVSWGPGEVLHRPYSAKQQFPNLVKTANLNVNRDLLRFLRILSYRRVPVCNPGAIIMAPFLDQLGIVEAIHTYGPSSYRNSEISNNIIVNVLRIVVGFPTIENYMLNSDRSVAIGAGLVVDPGKSAWYRNLDDFRFEDMQKLRNDLACRARELGVIEGKEIAIDYHCDPSASRYPRDQGQSRAPDKNGDLVYAHRPQLIWDCMTNSIINIAYCEGRSRAPTALYRFLEDNLFRVIDPAAIAEIYADSEYTGEKQLIYLHIRSGSDITMCLKQNKKIQCWKKETIREAQWRPYERRYRIASRDMILPEKGIPFRFVVKQNTETNEVRCFGSTHTDLSPEEILARYHFRWPVETGIRDLIENYYLNKPTGNSPEKVEVHYYCVMAARLLVDYFRSIACEPQWQTPEGWTSLLSTIRTSIFSSQNCELSLNKAGDLQLTYLDGDPRGIKQRLKNLLERRQEAGLNKVSWWGGRGIHIQVENRYVL